MLRTVIVDDEAPARSRLRRLLGPLVDDGRVEIVAEATDGVEALELLAQHPAELLLLDIQMPGLDGFEVVDRLPPGARPVIVFVTAFDRYAVKAFEAAAIDYLLKPVAEDRLRLAIERAERLSGRHDEVERRLADLLGILERRRTDPERPTEFLRQLSLPGTDRMKVVPVAQLLAAEVDDGLTRLFLLQDDDDGPPRVVRHTITQPLDSLEKRLDPEHFMRVHRSALIQLDHIREMVPWFSGRYKVVLTGGHEVIASRSRSRDLREKLSL